MLPDLVTAQAAAALPANDASVEALSSVERELLSRHWERRAKSELEVGLAFEALAAQGLELDVDPAVTTLLRRAAEEERVHSEICRLMAERYGARSVARPELSACKLPQFGESSVRLEFTLHLTGLCCINETVASAWIRECARVARTPWSLAANRTHLREEIDHARIGWAHLGTCQADRRLLDGLQRRLPELLRVNLRQWLRAELYVGAAQLEAHGALGLERSRAVIFAAARDLVWAGFEHVGFELPAFDALGIVAGAEL